MADKEKREVGDALGMVETRGLIGMAKAATDAGAAAARRVGEIFPIR